MNKKILRLAIPNIITNITIPLLGMVDLAILGHLDSEVYIGAIALGGMIFNFIYWGFGFLRMGTSGFTAQAYGARDLNESILTLSRALFVGITASFFLLVLQKPIALFSFFLIDGSAEVEALAAEYFYIRVWAAPATLGLYALTGWFLGMQNARFPMIIAVTINILNIGFNLFFVFVLGMKSDGVALGTLLAQYCGFVLGLVFFFRFYKKMLKYWQYSAMLKLQALGRFFSVNKDIFIRTLCLIFTFSFFTAKSAASNDTLLAVNTLLLQFLFFFSYLIDGFAYAAEALVGKYKGAEAGSLLRKSINYLFRWGLYISVPFTMIYFLAHDYVLTALTDNVDIIKAAQPYLWWVVFIPVITFPAFLWDGIYIGATEARPMRNTLLIATVVVFLPVYFISRQYIGNHALWLAIMLFMICRGLMLSIFAPGKILNPITE